MWELAWCGVWRVQTSAESGLQSARWARTTSCHRFIIAVDFGAPGINVGTENTAPGSKDLRRRQSKWDVSCPSHQVTSELESTLLGSYTGYYCHSHCHHSSSGPYGCVDKNVARRACGKEREFTRVVSVQLGLWPMTVFKKYSKTQHK